MISGPTWEAGFELVLETASVKATRSTLRTAALATELPSPCLNTATCTVQQERGQRPGLATAAGGDGAAGEGSRLAGPARIRQ